MIKVMTIGDLHCKISSLPRYDEATRKICSIIEEKKPELLVILGDIANDHERIHSACMHRIKDFFIKLTTYNIPTYYVVGNHDMQNNSIFLDPTANSIVPIAPKDIVTISVPMEIKIQNKRFTLVPYVYPGRLQEALRTIDFKPSETCAVFCHQEFKNAPLGILPSLIGDEWPEDYPLAVSGHIHDYCQLQSNMVYVGAPMQHGSTEKIGKTISLFSFAEDSSYSEERISLGLPEKINLRIDAAEFYKLDESDQHIREARIVVIDSLEEIIKLKNSKKYKELNKTAKIIVKPNSQDVALIDRSANQGKTYHELLGEAITKESNTVKELYLEITRED